MKSEYFINRELSWCEFNHRVLEEAMDAGNPLLERLRFASIVASNLDEFYMVRVAALKQVSASGHSLNCPTGKTASEILAAVNERVHVMVAQLYTTISQLFAEAATHGIRIVPLADLNPEHQTYFRDLWVDEIFPVLTPMAIDPAHPFPVLINLSLNLGVLLDANDEQKKRFAIVPIPAVLPRLVALPGELHSFVFLEEIIRKNLQELFSGQKILADGIFRITRDAEFEFDDEGSADLLQTVQLELRKRRTNRYVRLEAEETIASELVQTLTDLMKLSSGDVFRNPAFLDPRCLNVLVDLPGFDRLRYETLPPALPAEMEKQSSIWTLLKEQDLLLYHPFESFQPVVQFISDAARDPDVLAIKQTLYRTSGDSPIIAALERAAVAGKQVTVLLELMARFDEDRNIEWAKRLEQAGAHVIYGLIGLKTHAKILLIIRREKEGIRRYIHLGTGNYNDRTARLYTDIGLLTSDEAIGSDASGFFNTITGYSDPPNFKKLAMAPLGLRERFLHLIQREKSRASSGERAMIQAKMNSLIDPQLIEALYDASQAGVVIDLIVRGACCLRPGLKDVSDRISVISIVDRFLEHSRMFYFLNGGNEQYYASSADWMPRNLDRRVELLFPVESEEGRRKIRQAFDLLLSDNVKSRVLQTDGTYRFKKKKRNEEPLRAQEMLYQKIARQQRLSQLTFRPNV